MRKIVCINSLSNNKKNEENINRTLIEGISILDCYNSGFITLSEKKILDRLYPSGKFHCWGAHDGRILSTTFSRIEEGDAVLGMNKDGANLIGYVIYKMTRKDSSFSKYLWGQESTWTNIFFITNIHNINVSKTKINEMLGFKDNYHLRKLIVKEVSKGDEIINYIEGRKN